MTPAEWIADLDRGLIADGEDIILCRMQLISGVQSVAQQVTCRAFVRGYEPNQMVGGITQQDSRVIISPTQIIAGSWTGGRPSGEDQRVPIKGNKVVIAGRERAVEAVGPKYVAGELVRIEMRVLG